MKVTILNGNPDLDDQLFERYLDQLTRALETGGHQTTTMTLRDLDIRYCTGCFGCWVKTPGECVSSDDSAQVRQALIASDFTLLASPLRMGFPSALLKKTVDKFIPLIHPYFVVDQGEAHHRARYARYPRWGLLLDSAEGANADDMRAVSAVFSRTALNIKSRLAFTMLTDQPVEQVAAAITSPSRVGDTLPEHSGPTVGVSIAPPSRLVVFNGSPRGSKGNTPLMLEQFTKGFCAAPGRSYELVNLNRASDTQSFQNAFAGAECVLLGFPLYTDAMPGIVKAFIEALEPYVGRPGNPAMGFMVHSGFPEAAHSRFVERYLERLAGRLGSPYLGTMVRGGSGPVREMPEKANRKLFDTISGLGQSLAERGCLDAALLRRLAGTEHYPAYLGPVFRLLSHTPLATLAWDRELKQNGAFDQRFARPYTQ